MKILNLCNFVDLRELSKNPRVKYVLCPWNDLPVPTLIYVSQLSSIPGLEDVTVEVSPASVTVIPSGSHSESPSEQPQVRGVCRARGTSRLSRSPVHRPWQMSVGVRLLVVRSQNLKLQNTFLRKRS